MANWMLDIETRHDDFTAIRLVGLMKAEQHEWYFCSDADDVKAAFAKIEKGDTIWTWNGVSFDLPNLKASGWFDVKAFCESNGVQHKDAMLLAKMMEPDKQGGHSLDNYASKHYKGYKPWKPDDPSWYSDVCISDLAKYLLVDLYATSSVVKYLNDRVRWGGGSWEHALKVEQRIRELTDEQAAIGVAFNVPKALKLYAELSKEMETIERNLETWLPTLHVKRPKPPPKLQFKVDGTLSAAIQKYAHDFDLNIKQTSNGEYLITDSASYHAKLPITDPCPQFEKLTLSNQQRLKEWLMQDKGWKPTWWNTKKDPDTGKFVNTSPRLNHKVSKEPCPNLLKTGTEGFYISQWLMMRSRRSLLSNESGTTGLIKRATDNNGFIPSDGDTVGTNTARWRHKGIVNIPRVSSPYGKELRSLFCARPGKVWVGWDAASLEACIEAHYTFQYQPDYALALVEGDSSKGTDVHSRNQRELGLSDRDAAKTFKYAVTYGAQPPSLAGQLGCSVKHAEKLFDAFWDHNVGLRRLRDDIKREWNVYGRKYITGLDGRLIATRSEHSLINAKFQSGGAIVMKHAMLIANKLIKAYADREGLEAYGLIRYHDEEQWEVDDVNAAIVAHIGELGVQSITKAGEFLKLNVPLTGEYKIGYSWKDTH